MRSPYLKQAVLQLLPVRLKSLISRFKDFKKLIFHMFLPWNELSDSLWRTGYSWSSTLP